ncbi:MAG: PepSY domain-containing protein [Gammaproteobacteria bacterium]
MKWKPLLFFIHRWIGIFTCLLFALWFASGIVMMYVEYPELTVEERIKNAFPIEFSQLNLSPSEAFSSIGSTSSISSITLTSVLGRPAYLASLQGQGLVTVFADVGDTLRGLAQGEAINATENSGYASTQINPSYGGLITRDQWTVSSSLHPYRPLHKVFLNDSDGTVLYVSDVTGTVVRDTGQHERFWNWIGSTIHWIYPVQLRQFENFWIQLIIVVSCIGIVSVVTGGIIGFMRIRILRPYRGNDVSPYKGIMKWHHILGLGSLIFVFTFIFSGLMSMGPWGIFESPSSASEQIRRYKGDSTVDLRALPGLDPQLESMSVAEVEWTSVSGSYYYIATLSNGEKLIDFGNGLEHGSRDLKIAIGAAVPQLIPSAAILQTEILDQFDNYYYSRHNRYRPLPALRVKFDDSESTWHHIDSITGEPISRVTNRSRMERWMYYGLHSLDFHALWSRRPLWDIFVITLSLIGLGFSVTSIAIGWRRLVK